MSLEGKISVRVHWDGQRIVRAELGSRRPLQPASLLRGHTATEAAHMLPLLFSICAKAQGVAAVSALEAAQGIVPDPAAVQWRERLVIGEAIQELLWRFLLDLPGLMGEARNPDLLNGLRRRFASIIAPIMADAAWKTPGAALPTPDLSAWEAFSFELEEAIGANILGMPAAAWHRTITLDQISRWLHAAQTPTARMLLKLWNGKGLWGNGGVPLMPEASREQVLNNLLPGLEADPDFPLHPRWRGGAMETGALARVRDHVFMVGLLQRDGATVLARLLARLVELVELVQRLREPSPAAVIESAAPAPRVGLAWIQTARGLLLHRAELDEAGRILDYRIVAPTEWNFHPDGPCICGLAGRSAATAEEARGCTELLMQALDPCVAYQIDILKEAQYA